MCTKHDTSHSLKSKSLKFHLRWVTCCLISTFLYQQKVNVRPIDFYTLKVDVSPVNAVAALQRKNVIPLVQLKI